MKTWLQRFKPAATSVTHRERLRAAVGSGLGIALAGLCGWSIGVVQGASLPWIVAPMGASAMLIFTITASPLAQPWAVVAGNSISALIALLCVTTLGSSISVAALAVTLAILVMFATRSLHPPGAAIALLMVLNGIDQLAYAVFPVFLNSLVIVLFGLIYNNLTGKSYPHRTYMEPLSTHTFRKELEVVLKRHNEVIDISLEDLEALIEEATVASVPPTQLSQDRS